MCSGSASSTGCGHGRPTIAQLSRCGQHGTVHYVGPTNRLACIAAYQLLLHKSSRNSNGSA
jgi:hypothetical protein